jgi:hypothetical protein
MKFMGVLEEDAVSADALAIDEEAFAESTPAADAVATSEPNQEQTT